MTYADKSLLLGDEVAKLAMAYAAELAHTNDADDVEVKAISSDGDNVTAVLLLGGGSPVMIESANTDLPEPENGGTEDYMRRRIDALQHQPEGGPLDGAAADSYESYDVGLTGS